MRKTVNAGQDSSFERRSKEDDFKVVEEMRGGSRITDQNAEENFQALEKYAQDLTDLARKGKLDPVIGRDDEIRRTIQILSEDVRTIRS